MKAELTTGAPQLLIAVPLDLQTFLEIEGNLDALSLQEGVEVKRIGRFPVARVIVTLQGSEYQIFMIAAHGFLPERVRGLCPTHLWWDDRVSDEIKEALLRTVGGSFSNVSNQEMDHLLQGETGAVCHIAHPLMKISHSSSC